MSNSVLDLASPLFLAVATFRRRAKRGTPVTGDEIHEEFVQIFREQDQRAEVESSLNELWQQARPPLVYLVDEVMMNTEWEYRGWWTDNSLETQLLGHPQRMRGIKFFDELDAARQRSEEMAKSSGPARQRALDLLTIFYCCLRFGFEGKFAGQQRELDREAQQIMNVLPAGRRARSRELFQEAYEHTVEIPPQYETVMRFATIIAILASMIVLLVVFRGVLSNDLLNELREAAQRSGDFFS